MCSCDAEIKPQPGAVDNAVTDPPTETNQVKSDNPDDSKSEVADRGWMKALLEIRIIQLAVSCASFLHTIDVYVGRFECIRCVAYSHSHTYGGVK